MAREQAGRTIRRLRVGQELKDARIAAGYKLEAAARLFERSVASLSKIETGNQRILPRDLHAFFAVYGIDDEDRRAELLALVRKSNEQPYQEYGAVVPPKFHDYLSLERDATKISSWGEVIPGLLQTEAYAFQVVEAGQWEQPEQVERFVQLRVERQAVLTRTDPPPPTVLAVMGERVVRQMVGGPDVMRGQLEHLLRISKLPNVSIQIMPFRAGPHPGDNGAFTTMHFQDQRPVAVTETLVSATYMDDPETLRRYEGAGEQIRMAALSPRETASLIRETMEGNR
ncbi:helix-turn-helix domain-containing protein [Streptomyces sp. SID3343]|nr:helix-turn-helix domain-containing protein [Streptomyces sp. SID3343]